MDDKYQEALSAILSIDPVPYPVYQRQEPVWVQLRRILPRETVEALVECPDDSVRCRIENGVRLGDRRRYVDSLWNMIQHLNDDHKWTRERIADWLDSLDLDLEFQIPEDE